ncbi:hypothetical protein BS47DRAFT_1367976 [Hydnum rufescens UP504]|uniref:Uncharacterized protein n=1 Tax=Hydnum rufescens UP504 TaxID=1448309 RepID=A0A9P6DNS8_9AGAM|nr:hypothetical protein BS47DRAFT_1367976 [Hydnum rufescens UP504]
MGHADEGGGTGVGKGGDAGEGGNADRHNTDTGGGTGTGKEGDVGAGKEGNAGAGKEGNAGAGKEGNVGAGKEGNMGTGKEGNMGTGKEGNMGTGKEGNVGTGKEGDAGAGKEGNVGTGKGDDTGTGKGCNTDRGNADAWGTNKGSTDEVRVTGLTVTQTSSTGNEGFITRGSSVEIGSNEVGPEMECQAQCNRSQGNSGESSAICYLLSSCIRMGAALRNVSCPAFATMGRLCELIQLITLSINWHLVFRQSSMINSG